MPFSNQHSAQWQVRLTLTFVVVLLCAIARVSIAAPPSAITHDDALRVHQNSTITSDWSDTEAFDLHNPVDISAIVTDVVQPQDGESGYVILTFRLDLPREKLERMASDIEYVAILQTGRELERIDFPLRELSRGVQVKLTAWPRTQRNFMPYMMLIESITLNGTRLGLHDQNEALQTRIQRGPPNTDFGLRD